MVHYANVTLSEPGGSLEVTVFLPASIPTEDADAHVYYYGSRFDHSSMIGPIERKYVDKHGKQRSHILYGADLWRMPHNSHWPESGVGLASEFGVGDDGDFCSYRCGWPAVGDVTNGVLGYREAKSGEPFLKIGVGKLIKSTCPACDSAGDYRFNSPYLFAEEPLWKMETIGTNLLRFTHQATINNYGYHLIREVSLKGQILSSKITLKNLGSTPFKTAWYSHNFFTCDGIAVGPGYKLSVDVKNSMDPFYIEPNAWSWSTPLANYANVSRTESQINVDMVRALEPGVRIRSQILDDDSTTGSFSLVGCDTTLHSSIPEVHRMPPVDPALSMYDFNIYAERGTLSPEPQVLIQLNPGQATSWTQRLEIIGQEKQFEPDLVTENIASLREVALSSVTESDQISNHPETKQILALSSLFLITLTLWRAVGRRSRRKQYEPIPTRE